MDAFAQKGFEAIGALRTNRLIYPNQIRQQAKQFAQSICKDAPNVSLVTVGKRSYYVYRYQGKMNDHEDAAVLLSYNYFRNCVLQVILAHNAFSLE